VREEPWRRWLPAHRLWVERNRERIREKGREWYAKNRDKIIAKRRARGGEYAQVKVWRAKNPEWARDLNKAWLARRRAAGGQLSHRDIQRLLWFQDGICYYCRDPLPSAFHVEHMTPISRGGVTHPRNICLSCGSCNSRKNDRTAEEFLCEMM